MIQCVFVRFSKEDDKMVKDTILVIDVDVDGIQEIMNILSDSYRICTAGSFEDALLIIRDIIPELILIDSTMSAKDGFDILEFLKTNDRSSHIPVIFITPLDNPDFEVRAFDMGSVDYITKPFVPKVVRKRIETQIKLAKYEHKLEELVEEKVSEIEDMYDIMAISFAGLVESRDGITGGHLKNTAIYYKCFIDYLVTLPVYSDVLTPVVVKKACRSAPLHDVGKIAIEDAVLRKSSALSGEEFEKMKKHAVIGGDIFHFLSGRIEDKQFGEIAEQVSRYHHEKWDGTGYPEGLKGEQIPLVARIMSIVDVYDALTSKRPYKEPYSHEKSMKMIIAGRGTSFDPALVDEFVKIGDKIKKCLASKENYINNQRYFMYEG